MVSYYAGVEGFSPSEWIKDKLAAAEEVGDQVTLLTSSASFLSSEISNLRIPSLSWKDYKEELEFRRKYGDGPSAGLLIWGIVPATLGRLTDFFTALFAGSWSQGKWSWCLFAAPAIWLCAKWLKIDLVLATGGPTSAQFSAALVRRFLSVPVVLEFQDPFFWHGMGVGERARRLMFRFESFMVKNASRVVFVTKEAAARCKVRHQKLGHKIFHIYPFSKPVDGIAQTHDHGLHSKAEIRGIHLGTLYGSRNFDNLFKAVRSPTLTRRGHKGSKIHLTNLGGLHVANKADYEERENFSLKHLVPRDDSIRLSAAFDFLILVQHDDERSEETIPFKTYDYLNLRKPILAIVNSPELSELLSDRGHFIAKTSSVDSIELALEKLLNDLDSWCALGEDGSNFIDSWARLTETGSNFRSNA